MASAYRSAFIGGRGLSASAVVGLYPANAVRDGIELHTGECRNELQRWLAPNL